MAQRQSSRIVCNWSDQYNNTMFQESTPISHGIAHRLEQLILDGDYKPGQKIPSERKLTERLGVSRSLVREALKELQGRGVIKTQHGKGSFVSDILPVVADESVLMRLFQDHSRTLYDLLEVREQLEGQAAKLAAERGTEQDFYQITKAMQALEASDALVNASLDHDFHRAIAEASHNPVLIHVLNSLKELTLQSVQVTLSNLSHRNPIKKKIDQHHRQIYNAILSRQPQWAMKAAASHVHHVRMSLLEIDEKEHGIIRQID